MELKEGMIVKLGDHPDYQIAERAKGLVVKVTSTNGEWMNARIVTENHNWYANEVAHRFNPQYDTIFFDTNENATMLLKSDYEL